MIAIEFVLSYSITEGYNACAAVSNFSLPDKPNLTVRVSILPYKDIVGNTEFWLAVYKQKALLGNLSGHLVSIELSLPSHFWANNYISGPSLEIIFCCILRENSNHISIFFILWSRLGHLGIEKVFPRLSSNGVYSCPVWSTKSTNENLNFIPTWLFLSNLKQITQKRWIILFYI